MSVSARSRVRAAARAALGDRGRALVRRAELATGMRPRVNHRLANTVHYPDGRRTAVVISADLELAWAWRYARVRNPLDLAYDKATNGRKNMGTLLDACDAYSVPITWATVGHLMLDSCERLSGLTHPDLPRVGYFSNERWSFQRGDWFDNDPGLACVNNPKWLAWYAPDLVQGILARPTPHEIGCHTFSHIPFAYGLCPPEVAAAELQLCQALASRWGLTLRSFVFPGNIAGNCAGLASAGFQNYRSELGWWELDLPRQDAYGLWALPAGMCLDRTYRSWTAEEHFAAIRRYIDLAISTGLVCTLWFHPEDDPAYVEELFPRLFAYLASRQSELWMTTSSGLTQWLAESEIAPVAQMQPAT